MRRSPSMTEVRFCGITDNLVPRVHRPVDSGYEIGSRIKARDSVKGRYGWADSGWRMADGGWRMADIHFSKKIKSKKKRGRERRDLQAEMIPCSPFEAVA